MKARMIVLFFVAGIVQFVAEPIASWSQESLVRPAGSNDLLELGPFIQIPGPNPILIPGLEGTWEGGVVETSDAFKDFGTYYLYYHGNGGDGYQLGVATAPHPLGPFEKYDGNPILERGSSGSWDDVHVACAMILKEGSRNYTMWYSGYGHSEEHSQWGIGLATANHPLGPWKKHEGNPVMEHFGYVGGVVKAQSKYHLYTAHPIGSTGPDYSPMSLATAERPEGPWTVHPENPVLKQGEWGDWDDGGFSEAEVLYRGGVFHMFYGGAKLYEPRIATRESIGYAYSVDGVNFMKHGRNPVAAREANPNASAFAEVHAIMEPPFIYLYHTLRYKKAWRARFEEQFPGVEDLGVQVLAMARPFALDMPILRREAIAPKTTTAMADSPPICLSHVSQFALTAECTFSSSAKAGIQVHARSSYDGIHYDTADLHHLELPCRPGKTARKTISIDTAVRFLKILVENLDESESVSDITITATLGG